MNVEDVCVSVEHKHLACAPSKRHNVTTNVRGRIIYVREPVEKDLKRKLTMSWTSQQQV